MKPYLYIFPSLHPRIAQDDQKEKSKKSKQNSKNRKRRAKEQKADIEIKMTPYTPKKSYVHHTSEDEDMIVYDIDEDGREQFKHIRGGYMHIITPTKYQKK
ncbi:hypothetical protein TNIN_60091 [Trichonephila inaurata madagascariensis]|uniref:Uncharacterized protein n=1 Tax=Trichonephila inaurata madagascariensis TaxID=2747483 RepID=A0A8X7CGR1_9ARAC|nr:hypothetical protein TNIN_60091 [Trichonephila inaurata madagascariensis]